jgi:hypothetical protein
MGLNQHNTTADGTITENITFKNGTADFNGTADALILDQDGDTTISASSDDQIDIKVNGANDFSITSNSFNILSGSSIAGPSASTFVPLVPIAAFQSITGAGPMETTSYLTKWTTTGANAGTLADGSVKGQLKKIQMIVDGGDGTLTPTNLAGGTTITFADAGDFALLCFDGTDWVAIELGNDADGVTAPVLA